VDGISEERLNREKTKKRSKLICQKRISQQGGVLRSKNYESDKPREQTRRESTWRLLNRFL
jgi:hypothetical protein